MAEMDFTTASIIMGELQRTITRPLGLGIVSNCGEASPRHYHVEVEGNVFSASEITSIAEIAFRHDCSILIHPQTRQRGGMKRVQVLVCEIRGTP